MLKLIRRWRRRRLKERLRKLLYERLRLNEKVEYEVEPLHKEADGMDMLGWGRSLAYRANIVASDIRYQDGLFCFMVHRSCLPTRHQLYRLHAIAFYDDYLVAPFTVGKLFSRLLSEHSDFVVYTLQVIDTRQSA